MDIKAVRNSIRSALDSWDSLDTITDNILKIFMVETWSHTRTESLGMSDLTDAEFRLVGTWVMMERKTGVYREQKIRFIKETREVFPGLSLRAAKDFVEGSL